MLNPHYLKVKDDEKHDFLTDFFITESWSQYFYVTRWPMFDKKKLKTQALILNIYWRSL